MTDIIQPFAEWCALGIEALGVAVITIFAFYSLGYAAWRLCCRDCDTHSIYRTVRQRLGHGILVGLEFLVAADIIHTVAVELTFRTLGVLAIIVAIRTFLSFTLEVELTGNWPWQHKREAQG